MSGHRDRHEVRPEMLTYLLAPVSHKSILSRIALRWRWRTFLALLLLSLVPVLLRPTLAGTAVSLVLMASVFVWDAFARRCRHWVRFAREHQLLQALLSSEPVEAFYATGRDEKMFDGQVDEPGYFGEHPFGERLAAKGDPTAYLRYLWIQKQLQRFLQGPGSRILDLGCQHGLLTRLFDRPGDSLVAVDLNPESLKFVRRRHPQWLLAGVAAHALPFRSDHFNLVNFTEVIEHLSDPRAALAEVRRCLQPGGMVFLTTNNRHGLTWAEWINPLCIAEKVVGMALPRVLPPPALVWEHETLDLCFYHTNFDIREIRGLIQQAGLEIMSLGTYCHLGELNQLVSRLFPNWTERQAARLLYGVDLICNALPVTGRLGMYWAIVARKPGRQ